MLPAFVIPVLPSALRPLSSDPHRPRREAEPGDRREVHAPGSFGKEGEDTLLGVAGQGEELVVVEGVEEIARDAVALGQRAAELATRLVDDGEGDGEGGQVFR